ESDVSSCSGCFEAALLIVRPGFNFRYDHTAPEFVDRDKGKIRGINVPRIARPKILDIDVDPDFHRSIERAIDTRFEVDDLPELDGSQKIHLVHTGSHADAAAMALGAERRGNVHPVHQASA